MALFTEDVKTEDVKTEDVKTEEAMGDDTCWGKEYAGMGTEELTGDALNVAYLSIVQPGSTSSQTHLPATWRNSASDINYGPSVKVIPMAFKMVWVEREKDYPYFTVNRYEPNSVPVNIIKPKPGTRGFPEMFNPDTGNKIQNLPIYAVILPDYPDDGVLYFSPTIGSFRTCKTWNTLLRSARLPDGSKAAIFQYQWILGLGLVQNPKKPNDPKEQIAKFIDVKRGPIVDKAFGTKYILPFAASPPDIKMLMAPEVSGDVDVTE